MLIRVVSSLLVGSAMLMGPAPLADAEGPHGAGAPAEHSAPAEPGHQAHGSAPGAHGSEGIQPLDFQKDLSLWTAVVFLVLMGLLWKLAWKPIAEGLEKRERRIAEDISSAEEANQEARRLLDEYQQKLAAAKDEVRQILDAARRDAEQVGREIVDGARADAQAEHQRALREIDRATAAALKELAERSAVLAVELAGRIVDAKLDPQAHRRLIEQAVADFATRQPSSN